jgi:imidazolonepropionase-like amidohydrolase
MADIRSAGIGATVPGGHPTEMGGPPFPLLQNGGDAEAFVKARIAEGSDYIKVFEDDGSGYGTAFRQPTLDAPTLHAIVEAAHRHDKLVIAHIATEAGARTAILAGVDGLAHLFVGTKASPDFGRFARAHHVFVVPTLSVQYWWCSRSRGPVIAADKRLMAQTFPGFAGGLSVPARFTTPSCAATDEAVKQLRDADVPILAGTDSPIPGTTYGASTLDELGLLVNDGLTPVEALQAGTSAPARIFGLKDRGEIRPGARADLLLVDGDPTRNIDAVKNISAVWKRGIPVQRVTTVPTKPAG